MGRTLSRKDSIELYERGDEATRTTFIRCLNNDIVNFYRFLQTRLVSEEFGSIGDAHWDAVAGVLKRRDFVEMLDLFRCLERAVNGIAGFEKRMDSLVKDVA